MMLRPEPYCPGCEKLAKPVDVNGVVRWSCGDRACVVDSFVDSWNPNPTLPRQREAGLFDRRPR